MCVCVCVLYVYVKRPALIGMSELRLYMYIDVHTYIIYILQVLEIYQWRQEQGISALHGPI